MAFAAAPRLRTFQIFQQKLTALSGDEPEQRALCRFLTYLVGSYIEAFDEKPLPVAVADRAFQRLLDLVASLDFRAGPDHRLADLNRVAAVTSGIDRVKPQRAGRRRQPSGAVPRATKAHAAIVAEAQPSRTTCGSGRL
jgi:hypothetical protein